MHGWLAPLHVPVEECCDRCGAECDDSFHQIWSSSPLSMRTRMTMSANPSTSVSSVKKTRAVVLDQTHGPSRMDGGAGGRGRGRALRVAQFLRSAGTVGSNCLIMFLDGTGGPFSRGALSPAILCFQVPVEEWLFLTLPTSSRRPWCSEEEVVCLAPNKSFPDLRYSPISDNASCPLPRKGGRTPWVIAATFGTSSGMCSSVLILEEKSHVSEWSLWSGHQARWMYAGNECAHRLEARGPERTSIPCGPLRTSEASAT